MGVAIAALYYAEPNSLNDYALASSDGCLGINRRVLGRSVDHYGHTLIVQGQTKISSM